MMRKILIANRGEIARRILHTCRERGIASVAVHSEIDRDAPFAREADETVALEGTSALETYLNVEKIIDAAKRTGADAVHPGYGFLSENAAFAQAVQDAGLTWIGPSPQTILQMGSKARARELAQKAVVPVVPGFHEAGQSASQLLTQAKQLGFPVLIKASAGGGGKGMRVVETPQGFVEALQAARREAKGAFGDDHLIVEKFLENPRHIEVQVFGDAHGNVVHLFERECSIQRRHQKILEESPSSALDEAARQAITQAAVKLAHAADYQNAGTVEFILDESGKFYFLEMNTRLQVEHPVTEGVTGLDLVALQLRVAAGEPLPFRQADLTQRGHAIEVRVYAEDAEKNFAPQTGTLQVLRLAHGPGVRWDVGVEEGSIVSPHYDPLLGKLIVYGEDRPAAIRRLQKILDETVVLGVQTNLPFLQAVAAHPAFVSGETTTAFIERHLNAWRAPAASELEWLAMAAFEAWGQSAPQAAASDVASTFDPWNAADRWRNT